MPPWARRIPANPGARHSGGHGRAAILTRNPGNEGSGCRASRPLRVGPPRQILGPRVTFGPRVALRPGISLLPRVALRPGVAPSPGIGLRPRIAIPSERIGPGRAALEVHNVVVAVLVLIGWPAEVPCTGQIGVDIEPLVRAARGGAVHCCRRIDETRTLLENAVSQTPARGHSRAGRCQQTALD